MQSTERQKGADMNKYGKSKWAYFEDGMMMECARRCDLKRRVRERREIEEYHGRVWFRPCSDFLTALDKALMPFK